MSSLLDGLSVQPVTHDIAALAGELDGRYAEKGKSLNPQDVFIGATALYLQESPATSDRHHLERLEGLELWTYRT